MKRKWLMIGSLGVMACLIRTAIAQEHERSDKGSSAVATAASSTATSNASHASASAQALRSSASEERAARLEGWDYHTGRKHPFFAQRFSHPTAPRRGGEGK